MACRTRSVLPERVALVRTYLDLADGRPHLKWGNHRDPLAWIRESAGLRRAYSLIAGYIENGGRILNGYWPNTKLPEKWYVDGRSASRIREDIGLDPLDGFSHPFARVFRSTLIDDVVEAQSGL
jgi:hypothetical protein